MREGGRSDNREGALTGLRGYPLAPEVLEAAEGVRRPPRLSFGGETDVRGDSGRGRDGRRIRGRAIDGLGPTDLLKFGGGRPGVVGTAKVFADEDADRRVTYLLLFIGTKIPEPGTEVAKYFRPSTSPLFFPRCACSGPSSTPAKRPGLPATVPRYLTVPYMPPGTLTTSPTLMSSMAAMFSTRISRKTGFDRGSPVLTKDRGGVMERAGSKKAWTAIRSTKQLNCRAQRGSWSSGYRHRHPTTEGEKRKEKSGAEPCTQDTTGICTGVQKRGCGTTTVLLTTTVPLSH